MVPSFTDLVPTPLNIMIVQNKNIITFLMFSAPFLFLPPFLSTFRVRLHLLLFLPLIVSLQWPYITNHPSSSSIVKPWPLISLSFWLCLFCASYSSWTEKAPVSCLSSLFPWLWCILKGISLLWSHDPLPSLCLWRIL